MPVISKISDGVKEFTKWNKSTIRNININGTDYHFANKTECNGNCEDAVNEPLIDLKVNGNSVQQILPSGYKQLQYITSTDTQIINTYYTPTEKTKVYAKFKLTSVGANYPFGVRETSQSNICYVAGGANNWNFRFGASASYSLAPADTELHEIEMSLDGVYFDGELKTSVSQTAFTCPGPLYLFGLNNNGANAYGDTHLYEFKIWDSGKLIKHYIPCIRLSDDVVGLYDIVRECFESSTTQYNLISGEDILPSPDTPIEINSSCLPTKNLFDIPDITGSINNTTIKCNITQNIIVSCQESPTSIRNTSDVETSIWRFQFNSLSGKMQYTMDAHLRGKSAPVSIKATEDDPIVGIIYRGIYIKEGKYSGIQIEYGDNITEYEPYGYKIPIKIQSNNLFDFSVLQNYYNISNGNVEVKSSNTLAWASLPTITLKPLTTYTLSVGNATDIDIRTPNNVKLFRGITNSATFITDDTGVTCLKLFTTDSLFPHKVGHIQLEEGTSTSSPVIYNVYIKEPLRKVGDYADYIDYKNKKVIRNVRNISLNIKDMNNSEEYPGWRTVQYISEDLPNQNSMLETATSESCNISNKARDIGINTINGNTIIWLEKSTHGLSQTEWKEQYPDLVVNIHYGLQTPIEEPIDIPDIILEDGTNKITTATSVEADIQATYWKQI